MNQSELEALTEALVRDEISSGDHGRLQAALKADSDARDAFRERMDLEASLRTWAEESPSALPLEARLPLSHKRSFRRLTLWSVGTGASAALLLIAVLASSLVWNPFTKPGSDPIARVEEASVPLVGMVRQLQGCKWAGKPLSTGSRFAPGQIKLKEGVAKLEFDSGAHVVLEGPCEFVVADRESAQLLAGNVFVHVTEISNGFLLETPDAQIIDEGTQYAVALNDESTEVHVFDGSVTWLPAGKSLAAEDRIEAGQARRYQRGRPAVRQHIPLGERQFVRRIEESLKHAAGDSLLAYDGFENLAGQLRRDRSGFGWSGGWQQAGRGRVKLATVADAPPDTVFGINRTNRRLLLLGSGNNIRREFEKPLTLTSDGDIFVSFLVERLPPAVKSEGSLQISFEPESLGGRRRWRTLGSFGFTTEGFPFTNIGNAISKNASPIEPEEVCFVVVRISATGDGGIVPAMRVFHPGETIPTASPDTWTLEGQTVKSDFSAHSLRISAGQKAGWRMDELKVGATWQSVTATAD